jgi:hypothetical protein
MSHVSEAEAERHTVPALARASAGHTALVPLQVSAGSHEPCELRHSKPAGAMVHVPTLPGRLQESQAPPLHVVLQQTPSTQLPLAHWLLAVQAVALVFLGTQAPALQ